ncbi:MAG: phosphate acyltransferase PlsX [Eggerthellaceae bacterium]|nr:phosphate acyltransferase PlsX [Eggerthellaceae bacterium]
MHKGSYIIALDAVGGDNAPEVVLQACDHALYQCDNIKILLCGPADIVDPFCYGRERLEAIPCGSVIEMYEDPMKAIKKKDSSIRVSCELVKAGKADAFFSAGSTAACYVTAALTIGRIKGVKYPALCAVLPSLAEGVSSKLKLLCDCGANANCEAEHILQFAKMADVFAKKIMGIEKPKIKLLNIGEEDSKGSETAAKAHKLMAKKLNDFCGNAEGDTMLVDDCDIIVTDGFTGNVALKTLEGTTKSIMKLLKSALNGSTKSKMGALFLKNDLCSLKDLLNTDQYGGVPVLGLKAPVIIGHGSSNADAIFAGILTCIQQVDNDVCEILAKEMG